MNLNGKKILITGGGSGIGLELARRLSGANEVVIAGRDEAKLERARAQAPALKTIRLDVTSENEAQHAVKAVVGDLGGLDLLVNSAGVMGRYAFSSREAAAKSVEEVEVNLSGAIRMTRLALPLLDISSEAGVVFMSSAVALAAVPEFAVYGATMAALHSLARSLRAELESKRIRVFEVLPPLVDTDLAGSLDVPKIQPAVVVDAIVAGLARNREEIRVDRVKQLAPLARLVPRLADRIVQRALQPRANGVS
jgi:uncharacterized oxidoreductase